MKICDLKTGMYFNDKNGRLLYVVDGICLPTGPGFITVSEWERSGPRNSSTGDKDWTWGPLFDWNFNDVTSEFMDYVKDMESYISCPHPLDINQKSRTGTAPYVAYPPGFKIVMVEKAIDKPKKCECGAASCGSRIHSDWCAMKGATA